MPILDEAKLPNFRGVGGEVPNRNDHQPHAKRHDAPRCKANSKRTGKRCRAPAVRGCRVCRMHGARGGAPTGKAFRVPTIAVFSFEGDRITNERVYLDLASLLSQIGRGDLLSLVGEAR